MKTTNKILIILGICFTSFFSSTNVEAAASFDMAAIEQANPIDTQLVPDDVRTTNVTTNITSNVIKPASADSDKKITAKKKSTKNNASTAKNNDQNKNKTNTSSKSKVNKSKKQIIPRLLRKIQKRRLQKIPARKSIL